MRRQDISGWTWRIGSLSIEFVTVRHWLSCVALYHQCVLIHRFERHTCSQ